MEQEQLIVLNQEQTLKLMWILNETNTNLKNICVDFSSEGKVNFVYEEFTNLLASCTECDNGDMTFDYTKFINDMPHYLTNMVAKCLQDKIDQKFINSFYDVLENDCIAELEKLM